ncbi:transmembrane protein 126A [Brienomyrus brachyistius]|uniref:transmembrane protein 126A n=1 Tax=Brienomyrus brachyistius TaxID=42636 RepID=UPI0020B1C97B|nr:transmembrane protein 126A [Brienomyrus brachyistius]
MSHDTIFVRESGEKLPRSLIIELLLKKYERLPDTDKKLFAYGPVYLGANGAFAGLIANSLFRRVLNVTQGRITSCLPMAVLPFLTTVALYNGVVSNSLMSGELNCPTCALIRGGVVGAVSGGLYPILLALPVNAGLATRYNTAPMPGKGNILRFWMAVTQPIVRKMSFVVILQTLFGVFLSSKHYDIYVKMLKLPETDSEELKE